MCREVQLRRNNNNKPVRTKLCIMCEYLDAAQKN